MKQFPHITGYNTVNLCGKNWIVHRLVAQHFISNPENKPLVNHKDGNKLNNESKNLEWVTHSENTQHASSIGLVNYSKNYKPVIQYNINHEELARFPSIKDAGIKNGLHPSAISGVCNGKINFFGGFVWRFIGNPLTEVIFEGAEQIEGTLNLILPDSRIYSARSKNFLQEHTELKTYKKYCYIISKRKRTKLYVKELMGKYFPKNLN